MNLENVTDLQNYNKIVPGESSITVSSRMSNKLYNNVKYVNSKLGLYSSSFWLQECTENF